MNELNRCLFNRYGFQIAPACIVGLILMGCVGIATGRPAFAQSTRHLRFPIYKHQLYQADSALLRLFAVERLEKNPFANVFIYKQQEYNGGRPYVYGSYHVDDWTVGVTPGAGWLNVSREILQNGLLTPAGEVRLDGVALPDPLETYLFLGNQKDDRHSVFAFRPPKAFNPVRLEVMPPSGTYHRTIRVRPSAEPDASIYFRLADDDEWQEYDELFFFDEVGDALTLYQNRIAEENYLQPSFYAVRHGVESEVIAMRYEVRQPPSADSDQDGIPDALEPQFDLPIFSSSTDYDGDGWDDLDELIRDSNPKSAASRPVDGDGDSWSDYDELLRFTSITDRVSRPAAPSFSTGETKFTIRVPSLFVKPDETSEDLEGSLLRVLTLAGGTITSATLTGDRWEVRVPDDQPVVMQLKKITQPDLVLSWIKPPSTYPLGSAFLYTGQETKEEWLNKVRDRIAGRSYSEREMTIDSKTTVEAIIVESWMAKTLGVQQPIDWDYLDRAPSRDQLDLLQEENDVELAMIQLQSLLSQRQLAIQLASNLIDSVSETTRQIIGNIGKSILYNAPIDPALLPPGMPVNDVNQALTELQTVIANVSPKRVTLNGVISMIEGEPVFSTPTGQRYYLALDEEPVVEGAGLRAQGVIQQHPSGEPDALLVFHVIKIIDYPVQIALNNVDSDGDGLPDQWEKFYFGKADANPDDDPDNDEYTNRQEFEAFTNPVNGANKPTVIPNAWLY